MKALAYMGTTISLLGVLPNVSFAQTTLSPVTVIGSYAGGGGGSGSGIELAGAGMLFPGYANLMGFLHSIPRLKDVRCTIGGGQKNTTSHADPIERQTAAESVFRTVQAAQSSVSRILGRQNPAIQNNQLEVTFADGGSETYTVVYPMFSVALGEPVPGSLKKGDGIAKPLPGCN